MYRVSQEPGPSLAAAAPALDTRSYVALLKELCEEYRLGEPEYELVGDTGPPHARRFTVRARLRLHERTATATTKKAARQLVAQSLYTYLRENLARLTKDFVEVSLALDFKFSFSRFGTRDVRFLVNHILVVRGSHCI